MRGQDLQERLTTGRRVRDLSRRLVVELLLLGFVLAAGLTVPLDEAPGTSWSFLAPFLLFVAHALVGLLVLVDAGRLAVARKRLARDAQALVVVGLAVSLVTVASGAASVLGVVDRSPAPLMALGWFVAIIVFARLWSAAHDLVATAGRDHLTHG